MTSPLLPSPFIYGDIPGGGNLATIVVAQTAPTISQNQQAPGTFWLVPEPGSGNLYYLAGFNGGVPQWEQISSASGTIIAVNGTTAEITATTASGVVTLSIPAAFVAPGSVTATTTLTATLGNITATNGNLVLGTAGNKLSIATGTNASAGVSAAMVAGVVTVATTAVTASSIILYSRKTGGGTQGEVEISAQVAGTSFTLTSTSATDTSTFNYLIIN